MHGQKPFDMTTPGILSSTSIIPNEMLFSASHLVCASVCAHRTVLGVTVAVLASGLQIASVSSRQVWGRRKGKVQRERTKEEGGQS